MSLRELATTSMGGLVSSTAILAAISGAPPLGEALWRVAYGDQEGASVLKLLVSECCKRYGWPPTESLWLLAGMALREWSEPLCIVCGGRRGYFLRKRWLGCPVCRETGLRRYSNNLRRYRMGEWNRGFEAKHHLMLRMLTDADGATLRIVRARLGLTTPSARPTLPPAGQRIARRFAGQFAQA